MKFKIWREHDFKLNAVRFTVRLERPIYWIDEPLAPIYFSGHKPTSTPLNVKKWDKVFSVLVSEDTYLNSALDSEIFVKKTLLVHFADAMLKDDELPTHIAEAMINDLMHQVASVGNPSPWSSVKPSPAEPKVPSYADKAKSEIVTWSSYANKAKSLAKMFPSLETFRADCPECAIFVNERLYDLIIHINDQHEWTREQIADFLDTLDVDLSIPLPAHVGSDDKFMPPMNVGSEKEE